MAASITVDTLISGVPSNPDSTGDMSEWLAKCYRWAEIENHPEVKESSWVGLVKIDDLSSRRQYRETVLSQLKAIKTITVTI